MILLRSLAYQLLFWPWTVFCVVACLPTLLLPRRAIATLGPVWCRGVVGLLASVVGLRHEVRGESNRPAGPAIYAFKHQSAWETLVMVLLLPGAAVVLKRELTYIPLFGWYLKRLGMIAVDRGAGAAALRAMVREAQAAADAGRPIVVFPEGTRRAPGAPPAYQPGIAALYRSLSLPVVPVALNSGVFWGRREFAKRPGTIVVSYLPPIAPGLERAAFAKALEDALEAETARLIGSAA